MTRNLTNPGVPAFTFNNADIPGVLLNDPVVSHYGGYGQAYNQ